jgi:hypothetical protein
LSGTISLTTQVSGTLGAGNGGTGISSYTVGDILYASGTTTLSSLADVATGNALISGGVSNAPLWGKIGLTTHVSGTLAVGNGGSGATTLTGYLKGNGTSAFTASATIPSGDITGAALTEFDDTNVTMTLGGSPSTALLAATSMTLGWTGQLAVSRGGTGNSTLASGYLLKGNGVSPTSASVIYDDGTNTGIGTTTLGERLVVQGAGKFTTNATNFGAGQEGALIDFVPGTFVRIGHVNGASGSAKPVVFMVGGNEVGRFDTSANFTANTSLRSPIYYDSDNTGFYLDPSSNSTSLRTNGAWITNPTSSWGGDVAAKLEYHNNRWYASVNTAFVVRSTTGSEVLWAYNTGVVEASNDFRAPIFYDSNNTAYYVNPASTSYMSTIQGSQYSVGLTNPFDAADGSPWYGLGMNSSGVVQLAGYYGLRLRTASSILDLLSDYAQANNSFRAPIFYDSNNTAFYIDAASTSVINGLNAGIITAQSSNDVQLYLNGNGTSWAGISWADATATDYIWYNGSTSTFAIGGGGSAVANKKLHINGGTTIGSGIAASSSGVNSLLVEADIYSGNGRLYLNNATNNFIIAQAGSSSALYLEARGGGLRVRNAASGDSWFTALDGTCTATTDFRAPIFYDSNNTAYYVDAASTSEFNTLQTRGGSGVRAFAAGSASISSQIYFADAGNTRAWNWQLDENNDAALWNFNGSSWTKRFTFTAGSNLTVGGAVTANQLYAQIFYDSQNGAYYVDPAGASNLFSLNVGGGSSIQSNGDFVARRSSGSTGVYYFVNTGGTYLYWDGSSYIFGASGPVTVDTSFRAPIFYDSNNTGYYIDGASTSNLNVLQLQGSITAINGYTPANSAIRLTPNLHLNALAGSAVILNWDNGTTSGLTFRIGNGAGTDVFTTYANGAVYASIIYDISNSAYYLDPASNSVLNVVSIGGRATTNAMYYQGFTLDANTMDTNATGFTYAVNAPFVGPIARISAGGAYDLWFNAPYSGAGYGLAFRTRNGDTATINPWRYPAVYDVNVNGGGALYATIYYDQNNTGYYSDPAATSVLNQIQFPPNTAQISGNETSSYGSIAIRGARNGWYGIHIQGGGNAPHLMFETGNGGIYFEGIGRWASYYSTSNNCWGFGTSATSGAYNIYCPTGVYSGGRVDGTIFYDTNDTGYYIDPNSTDNAAMRIRGGTLIGPNVTWGAYLRVGSNGWVGDHSSIAVTNGNLHIDAQPGFALYLAWYNTSTILVGGSLTANGNITAYSDIRVKDNVETIPNALDKLDQIRGVTYTRTDRDDKERRYAGVIAQEIEQVLPEAIFENEEYKSVDYNATIGLLIQAVKELTNKVKALEAKEQ